MTTIVSNESIVIGMSADMKRAVRAPLSFSYNLQVCVRTERDLFSAVLCLLLWCKRQPNRVGGRASSTRRHQQVRLAEEQRRLRLELDATVAMRM